MELDIKNFCNTLDFVDYLSDLSKAHSYNYNIVVIALYSDTKDIVNNLIRNDFNLVLSEEFADDFWDGYNNEYIIDITGPDISIFRAKVSDSTYDEIDGDVCYVLGSCNSKILPNIYADKIYDVEIYAYDEEAYREDDSFEKDAYNDYVYRFLMDMLDHHRCFDDELKIMRLGGLL